MHPYLNFISAVLLLLVHHATAILAVTRYRQSLPTATMRIPFQMTTESIKIGSITRAKRILSATFLAFPIFGSSFPARASEELNDIAAAVTTPALTAAEVLTSDINPRLSLLKDIQITFSSYPDLVNKADYGSIRNFLRQEPAVELRKTCKGIRKYLPAEKLKPFDEIYTKLINSVDDMDIMSLNRGREGRGKVVTPVGLTNADGSATALPEIPQDKEMLNIIETCIRDLNSIISLSTP